MPQTAIRLTTKTLPGKRIDVVIPELNEGDEVDLIILKHENVPRVSSFASAADYLASLAPISRTPEEWAQIERELQNEKDAWDR